MFKLSKEYKEMKFFTTTFVFSPNWIKDGTLNFLRHQLTPKVVGKRDKKTNRYVHALNLI